jgi:poly(A) polymerase
MPKATRREAALAIVKRLREHGHQAFWAGGCVRDMLIGRTPKDYDVATDARPRRVGELFRATREVGVQFGVVLVRVRGFWTEVATFRTDLAYEDGRRPSGVVFGTARQDSERRDFTVNGMFYDPVGDEVVDYVGGRADLQAGLIRAIGDPAARLAEDHLRVLRAVRFAARLGFEIEPATRAALQANASTIEQVSPERVREELALMLADCHRTRAFELMSELGLLPHLWPGARWSAEQVSTAAAMLRLLDEPVNFELAWAAVLSGRSPEHCGRICRRLACSNATRKKVCWLVEKCRRLETAPRPTLSELKQLMAGEGFGDLMQLYRATLLAGGGEPDSHAEIQQRAAAIAPEAVHPDPFITGHDLLRIGIAPGPEYKRILDRLYDAQLNEVITTRREGLELLRAVVEGRSE